jgi:CheY-like chemotaxis protein
MKIKSQEIKIAIADDHSTVREGLKILLEDKGFHVVINAENGEDLINKLMSSPVLPDLCFIDYNMPIMDGSETIQVIKSRSEWKAIKIIGISVEEENEKKMIDKGADGFISKHYLPENLYQVIIDITKS